MWLILLDQVTYHSPMCNTLPNKVKMQYLHFWLLSFTFEDSWRYWQTINALQSLRQYLPYVSNICPYNLLPWEWLTWNCTFGVKYLLCLIFAHTAFFYFVWQVCPWSYNLLSYHIFTCSHQFVIISYMHNNPTWLTSHITHGATQNHYSLHIPW